MRRGKEEFLYEKEFRALNREKIDYAVCGGFAVIFYGYARFTADLDLIVNLSKENLEKLYNLLLKLRYRLKAPIKKEDFVNEKKLKEFGRKKDMMVVSFFNLKDPMRVIDIGVNLPNISELLEKKKYIRIKNLRIPTISKNDLIKMKIKTARPRDLDDVENLKKIKNNN